MNHIRVTYNTTHSTTDFRLMPVKKMSSGENCSRRKAVDGSHRGFSSARRPRAVLMDP